MLVAVSYQRESTRPDSNGAMVEQSTDNPLRMMGDLVANHLQDVMHGSFSSIVHIVNRAPLSKQQIHYVWIGILTGHV